MDFLFHFSAASVLPFWIMMLAFPNAQRTAKIIKSPWIILPPTICYLCFLLPNLATSLMIFQDPSPEALSQLMGHPWGASLFWAYAGAFDLFVGRWIFFDAREHGINHWLIAPILFICILFGPLAFALYAMTRGIYYLKYGLTNKNKAS